ncbi:GNAT family N-acetyltransferase [Oceanobacillus halophilus]|uniref:GNAT family N-acetyltransferase n=1 Tax=Oceanobacillus halophilus TaxID=930130 RepID=A0A495A350_9BACI|nr:GNAT family N-acetyltransferase [Oceanobacillus halophilus]RKQ33943.1 GNAT family N-acetyltransferase [Oceanobacillus halophilus]
MHIRKLASNETPPMDLLLGADPDKEHIEKYLEDGQCYIGINDHGEKVIGVYVLASTKDDTLEIMNISVLETEQNKGIGKALVEHAIETAKKQNFSILEVGTGNSSISQIAFYQKCGFRMVEVDFDYFTRNYEEVIVENGIICRDMIRLKMDV